MPVTVSILMCAYNEERTIVPAINDILGIDYPCEIQLIVVDDGSTDATPILLGQMKDPRLVVHRHRSNRGKGAALRTAASLATGNFILPFDADLEYSAADVPRVLAPALSGRSDVVYGVRLFGFNTVYRSYRYAFGNRLLTMLANILYDAYLSDMHTCLKLIPIGTFRQLKLSAAGFGLDTEITALMLRLGIRPFEVPVSYCSRSHAQGKKITWRDAVMCLWILIRVRLTRASRLTSVAEPSPQPAAQPSTRPLTRRLPVAVIAPNQPRRSRARSAAIVMNNDGDGVTTNATNYASGRG